MRIGADRKIEFYNAYGATHVIVNVTGWYRPGFAAGASQLMPTTVPATTSPSSRAEDWLDVERVASRSGG
jgi:hypothetical protein